MSQHFDFQRFRIRQKHCAMKVGTDAMLLGAWTRLPPTPDRRIPSLRILDLGTGTGILALMLAQRSLEMPVAGSSCLRPTELQIDAIEIEPQAAAQARENIAASPWLAQIQVHGQAVQDWHPPERYDLIVCNPPFYAPRPLTQAPPARQLAREGHSLSQTELISHSLRLLTPNGHLGLIWPEAQMQDFARQAESQGLQLQRQCQVRHSAKHGVSRRLMDWVKPLSNNPVSASSLPVNAVPSEELILHSPDGPYTQAYRHLTAGYALASPLPCVCC